jgi:hypothetical protein
VRMRGLLLLGAVGLVSMLAGGGNLISLSNNGSSNEAPQISPDGTRVAYQFTLAGRRWRKTWGVSTAGTTGS